MTAKAIVLALMLTAVLLAGCSDKGGDDGDSPSASSSASNSASASTTRSGTTSSTGTGTGSSAPGTIAVNFTRATPNGAVPLAVNFTLDATFSKAGQPATAPGDAAWSVRILSGNATNQTSADGPTGTAFPSNFTLDFTAVGNHTVVVDVTASDYAPANATILVAATEGGAGAPLFFDGAEGDASQWVIASKVLVTNIAPMVPEQELAADHPSKYAASTDEAQTGTKSWHVAYNDNLRARLTSVPIAGAGGHTLSYALKGGAEGTSIEGLFVLAGPADGALAVIAHHSGEAIDWTTFTASLPASAGPLKVEFRFDTDVSCSSGTATVPPDDPVGVCGVGYDAGGYYIDDITVA